MKLSPYRNGILFVFINDVMAGRFAEETSWGFVIKPHEMNSSRQKAQWGKVVALGTDVNLTKYTIKVGSYILLEPLMWTKGFIYDNIKIWKTDDSKILMTSENRPLESQPE